MKILRPRLLAAKLENAGSSQGSITAGSLQDFEEDDNIFQSKKFKEDESDDSSEDHYTTPLISDESPPNSSFRPASTLLKVTCSSNNNTIDAKKTKGNATEDTGGLSLTMVEHQGPATLSKPASPVTNTLTKPSTVHVDSTPSEDIPFLNTAHINDLFLSLSADGVPLHGRDFAQSICAPTLDSNAPPEVARMMLLTQDPNYLQELLDDVYAEPLQSLSSLRTAPTDENEDTSESLAPQAQGRVDKTPVKEVKFESELARFFSSPSLSFSTKSSDSATLASSSLAQQLSKPSAMPEQPADDSHSFSLITQPAPYSFHDMEDLEDDGGTTRRLSNSDQQCDSQLRLSNISHSVTFAATQDSEMELYEIEPTLTQQISSDREELYGQMALKDLVEPSCSPKKSKDSLIGHIGQELNKENQSVSGLTCLSQSTQNQAVDVPDHREINRLFDVERQHIPKERDEFNDSHANFICSRCHASTNALDAIFELLKTLDVPKCRKALLELENIYKIPRKIAVHMLHRADGELKSFRKQLLVLIEEPISQL